MMTTQEYMDFLVSTGRTTMNAQGEHIPTLIGEDVEDHMDIMVLAINSHPFDALAMLAPTMPGKKYCRLSLTTDSYMVTGSFGLSPDEILELTERTPEELFKAGHPAATEALNFLIVPVEGPAQGAHIPYVRKDDGIEWGELVYLDEVEHVGRMVAALTVLLQLSNMTDEELRRITQNGPPVTPE